MARAKKEEKKLERTYTIPLKKEWLKAPRYKKSKKAIKAIKQFLAKHMKIPDRDLKKIKLNKWVNQAIWLRGVKKTPQKIIVKAIKDSEGKVIVEFVGLPPKFRVEEEKLRKKIEKEKKREEEKTKVREKRKKEEKKKIEEEKEKKTEEEKKEEEKRKEKEKALHKEKGKEKPEIKHEKAKHLKPVIQRKALEK